MEPEAFLNSLTPVYEFIYNNEVEVEPLQYPLAFSRYKLPKFANNLYTDNQETYFTYSGLDNSLIVTREKEGRYKNITLKAYSGDSFKFYLQTGSGIADPDMYFSGPLTTSGVYSTLTRYYTQSGAAENAITFIAPEDNTTIYTLPNILATNWMRLYHQSTDGSSPYRIYQFLPRTFIQVDDLDADVIDVVSLRVSGSIVVTADNLAPGSITGEKIMAGTVSGVLITPGTITANEIAAGTITANKLNVDKLSAITSNMGTLNVTESITVTSGYLQAGITKLDNTGIAVGSLTTALAAPDAIRIFGSGAVGNIVGMAFYNGSYSAINPQATIQVDATNALEIENNATNGLTNFNFPQTGLDNSAAVNIYNGNLFLRKSPNPPANEVPGTIYGTDSDDTVRYKLGPDQLVLNNNTSNTFVVDTSSGNVATLGTISAIGSVTTSGTLTAQGGLISNNDVSITGALGVTGLITAGDNLDLGGSLTATYQVRANTELFSGYNSGTGLYRFNADSSGNINTVGGIFAGTSNNKFTVAASTGNTAIAGTLGVTGKLTSSYMGYLTLRRNTTQSITTAGTTIVWNTEVRANNITWSSDTITVTNAGYYLISATFATVDNLTSLRMTLVRGTVNYVSTLHGAGLSTGGGYIFNMSIGFWATANSTYKINLVPSANTTLNANNEGFAGPSPIINIIQAIGV